jgi:hypothetical protein
MANRGLIRVKREGAQRARRLAMSVTSPSDRRGMLAFADELDAQADALEEAVRARGRADPAGPD